MIKSVEVRQKFLDFFKSKKHTIVPSAPIVIKDDPTLLFTNAGMNQFKDYFLGNKKIENSRVADTQKCLRVSGKHNDLEEVGVDTYHHTMFEMLGNWSFGDYFKAEAIAWSWEFLTEILKLDKNRLYVTVFEGDEKEKLPKDQEAYNEWKKFIAEERILLGNKKDNFWEMGDTGPCGPCTEIHVDCRNDKEIKKINGATLVNKDHPQVIEIWNNVFIQFNRKKDGSLEELPAKHVDTGMGFERLVRVLQNKQSNYDTDIFSEPIQTIKTITNQNELVFVQPDSSQSIAVRVISDHIRAICFTIADGQLPSNTGAGYVIRRILRRAVRYYFTHLNYKQPLLFQLVPLLANQFENVFPELIQQQDFVTKVIKEEEESFLRTLDKGLKRIEGIINSSFTEKNKTYTISGEEAFDLFDTYGFPLDLTKLIAGENSMFVDEVGFEKEMLQQKNRSRAATTLDTEDWSIVNDIPSSQFVGYDLLETKAKIVKYRKVSGKGKELYQIVLDKTPFYAESGGQVGDSGLLTAIHTDTLHNEEGHGLVITNTKKENDLIIHYTESIPGNLSAAVTATIDTVRRKAIAMHHSATHLMHAALRQVLGKHVAQKGSLVNDEYLRFDFSHFTKVSEEEIAAIESLVNEKIRKNIPVVIKEMKKDEAVALGAMALFGEKYGDKVRVVIMDPQYSIELCGGTHVGATGELGIFKIQHETAIAAGVRRIEAVCGEAAQNYLNKEFDIIRAIRETLKNPKDLSKAIDNLIIANGELKKKIESLEAKQLTAIKNQLLQKVQKVNKVNFIGEIIEVSNADALKKLCITLCNNFPSPEGGGWEGVIVVCSNIEGKAHVAISISDDIVINKNLDAGKIIKEHISPLIKGGGGGQKNLATAGGQDTNHLQLVIEKVKSLL